MLSILVVVRFELVALLERMARRRSSVWTSTRVAARVAARIHTVAVFVYEGLLEYGTKVKHAAPGGRSEATENRKEVK